MPLSDSLRYVDLTFDCPHCDHPLIKSGTWFQSVGCFKCEGCQREVQLTYDDKVALFDKHAQGKKIKSRPKLTASERAAIRVRRLADVKMVPRVTWQDE